MNTRPTLVKWLKAGYPHLKERSGLPVWILPERTVSRVADEFGEDGIIEMSRPLGSANGIENLLEKAPDPDTLPGETWRAVVMGWPPLSSVKEMVEACLEATTLIMRRFERGQLKADPVVVCRGMVTLGSAPFSSEGKPVLNELASILKGDAARPAELLERYAGALVQGDTLTVKQVDECIARYGQWVQFAESFIKRASNFTYVPKPIGITPTISTEMVEVLAEMMKEDAR